MKRNNTSIVLDYVPQHFGKEYCAVMGTSQYPMFAAVALEVKPVMDNWVPVGNYEKLVEACYGYGLSVVPNIVFAPVKEERGGIVGARNITTTFFRAERFTGKNKIGEVHVLIGRRREEALEAKKWGWYPLIIHGRSTNKPFVDHLRYGRCLGYPPCCIDLFRQYNNWHYFSNPAEAFRNTPRSERKAIGSLYCNNFLMDQSYSFIHHLPCSYRCDATISLAQELEKKLEIIEPAFVEKASATLKKPLLVFGERHFIIFDGEMQNSGDGRSISYHACQYFRNPSRPEEDILFFDDLLKGNTILMDSSRLIIKKESTTVYETERNKHWFLIDFD